MLNNIPVAVIAGTHSGCGKTTITLSLMAAFKSKGLEVAPFKVGPDFIDPGLHEAICKRPSYNLDTWMMSEKSILTNFKKGCENADIAIIEGVMGLFDGAPGDVFKGTTAHIARILKAPVILVVDVRSMAGSVAALVKGFLEFDPELKIAALILNRAGSERHKKLLKEALKPFSIGFLGFIDRNEELKIPSRHLGLITREDLDSSEIDRLSKGLCEMAQECLDLEQLYNVIVDFSPKEPLWQKATHEDPMHFNPGKSLKIAVARDEAFCFYYRRNLDILEELGAELIYFSPVSGDPLPDDVCGLYLGGGYPEIHADKLEQNANLRKQIVFMANNGFPIIGECGGFMFLNKGLRTKERFYKWVGLFPLEFDMANRFQALGYREIIFKRDCVLGKMGTRARGHEFRYSRPFSKAPKTDFSYEVVDARGEKKEVPGFSYKNCFASYVHLHFDSNQELAISFLKTCEDFKRK